MELWDRMDDVERSEYMRYMAELEEEAFAEKERLENASSEARRVRQAVRKAVYDSNDAWDMVDGKAVAYSESRMNSAMLIFTGMNSIGGAECSQESSSESS